MSGAQEMASLIENFFDSTFFESMVRDHMLFGFVGFDGSVGDAARQDMNNTITPDMPFENRAEYLRDRVEEMFCLSTEDFEMVVEKYNEAHSSSVVPDLPVDLLMKVHEAGSEQNKEACDFLSDYGQDTSPTLGGGMKP